MNSKVEQHGSSSAGDIVKYALAVLLVAAGVAAYIYFDQWAGALRALAVAGGLVLGAGVFLTSSKGLQTREFLSESRFELRKVVWPTRQEAMRTTWVVMIAVAVLSLILAGFDVVIQAAVKFLLGR
ncbi:MULTISPECIES: preprotein translocase subunit SecE [Lysobacter]|uniref:Protein translocase subunit SecE n=1 Tax=Lysobacter arenosi TaxID=2795387 RepID=A0ABX7RI84_9GAMM|nr:MULTISPECIES: preprotein translocase subunit SecE [Lysobacter]MDQ8003102.1 preprotein translocase subunit SecE [Pseudomonadota bacterium]QSX76556.1 preprotein translocase subunit SecE [Lysobacter arenosi]UNK49149.1 preprotein translocase subunit SecE [Lysobacter sp. S4-A87]